jgi:phosphopantetheinyl transferase (holo-ACP synthase)
MSKHYSLGYLIILLFCLPATMASVLHNNNRLAPDGAIPGVARKAFGMENLTFIVDNGLQGKATLGVTVSPVDDAPVISLDKSSLSFTEDGAPQVVLVSISDVDSLVSCANLSVSSNAIVLASSPVVSGSGCSVSIIPHADKNGSGSLEFTVNNGLSKKADLSFAVSSVDDAPFITLDKGSLNFIEDGEAQEILVSISDKDTAVSCTQVSVSSNAIVSASTPVVSGSGCGVSITPIADKHGNGVLTFTINNGASATASLSFAPFKF